MGVKQNWFWKLTLKLHFWIILYSFFYIIVFFIEPSVLAFKYNFDYSGLALSSLFPESYFAFIPLGALTLFFEPSSISDAVVLVSIIINGLFLVGGVFAVIHYKKYSRILSTVILLYMLLGTIGAAIFVLDDFRANFFSEHCRQPDEPSDSFYLENCPLQAASN